MSVLTDARAGLARSGATRAGYPIATGARLPLFALSNVARSGATRSNYHSAKPFISIDGIQRGWNRIADAGVLADSLNLSDAINNTPVTLAFTARGFVPVEGVDVVITLGSINNLRREFGGTILHTTHRYVGDKPVAANMCYDVSAIDFTWALDWRKVSGSFQATTVAAVAAALMAGAPPGYTLHVDPDIGAEPIDAMTFTEQTLTAAFTQLAKRVGGDYLCDYSKVVRLFFDNSALVTPTPINAIHPSLRDVRYTRDLSQVVTRCLGEFGGSDALAEITPGATLLPVGEPGWYPAGGGVVLVGQQRIAYGGVVAGGGGSLVGPGAAPTGVPNLATGPGAGVDLGAHDYAVTYTTASGESIAGPRVSVVVGTVAPPTTAPAAGAPQLGAVGAGPDPGDHDYAVSFVLPGGETIPGPRLTARTSLTPPPTTAPVPTASAGTGVDTGGHDYAVTFVQGTGETTPSPISGSITTGTVTTGFIANPTGYVTFGTPTNGGNVPIGTRVYGVTFLNSGGETQLGPTNYVITNPIPVGSLSAHPSWTTGGSLTPGQDYRYSVTFVTATGETDAAGFLPSVGYTGGQNAINLTSVPTSPDASVTARNIYRFNASLGFADPAHSFLVGTINNNGATTFTDTMSDATAATKPTLPTVNTTGPKTIPLVNIPLGPTGTTKRRLYRLTTSGSAYGLVATINDNTDTTYTDTSADASLGGAPPATNTTGDTTVLNRVTLTNIPRALGAGVGVVHARRIYRRSAGAGLRLVFHLGDNETTTYIDSTPNASLGAAPPTTNTATLRKIPLTGIEVGPAYVTARKLWRTAAGVSALKLLATLADNTTTVFVDTVADASLGAAAPTVGTAVARQVQLTAIPVGAAAVTARKIYRTAAGASQLKLLTTLADNVTTTWLDTALDATLGANVPLSDTSLLTQPQGIVLIGSPTLPVANVGSFLAVGGWAIVGSQSIRYTGLTASSLTGIPATGPGAILASVSFSTTAVAAPMLTGIPAAGVGRVQYRILKGDAVNIFVQEDDLAAQAAVRAQIPGSDGIIEDEIQDRRLSFTEGRARCRARLDLLGALDSEGKVGVVTVNYVSRDLNTRAGATIDVNLGPPVNLRGTYLIQRVTVNQYWVPNLPPTYTVEASSIRFSVDEWLRLMRGEGAA